MLAVPVGCLMAQTRGGAADVAMRVDGDRRPDDPVLLARHRADPAARPRSAPGFASLGYVPFSEDPLGNLQRMMLPAIALALPILANLSRLVRSAMLDALGQDYVRTARAKGLRGARASSTSTPCATR